MEVTVNVNEHGSGVFSDHLVRISTIGYCIEYETFESALGIVRVGFMPVERVRVCSVLTKDDSNPCQPLRC